MLFSSRRVDRQNTHARYRELGPYFSAIVGLAIVLWSFMGATNVSAQDAPIRIGSKSFTESVILGEMLNELAAQAGATSSNKELGGTQILWQALQKGDIDAYVEYSGTLKEEIFSGESLFDLEEIRARAAQEGIVVSEPLGFNNTYAIGMLESRADKMGIAKISDLVQHPDLSLGFSDEFVERRDGWPGLRAKYDLPQSSVRGLEHALAYAGVRTGSIDATDLYSTDAEIVAYDLRVLQDDLGYFPLYQAVILYRQGLEESHPEVVKEFRRLQDTIDDSTMASLNKAARIDRKPESLIAAEFLHSHVDEKIAVPDVNANWFSRRLGRFWVNTWEHLLLVAVSLSLAIAVAIPLGIMAYRNPKWGEWILGVVGIIQTIPSMALLVFMIPLLGLGAVPAIVALFLYSLLPIVRGTHTGLTSLPRSVHESALALGLPASARLRLIELPLAAQSILSGIKTAAVINVGTATIGALIGAGGYGQPIITGMRLADIGVILWGAIPAAILALLVQLAFSCLERFLVPAGLRSSGQADD